MSERYIPVAGGWVCRDCGVDVNFREAHAKHDAQHDRLDRLEAAAANPRTVTLNVGDSVVGTEDGYTITYAEPDPVCAECGEPVAWTPDGCLGHMEGQAGSSYLHAATLTPPEPQFTEMGTPRFNYGTTPTEPPVGTLTPVERRCKAARQRIEHDPHDYIAGEYLPTGDLGYKAHCAGFTPERQDQAWDTFGGEGGSKPAVGMASDPPPEPTDAEKRVQEAVAAERDACADVVNDVPWATAVLSNGTQVSLLGLVSRSDAVDGIRARGQA